MGFNPIKKGYNRRLDELVGGNSLGNVNNNNSPNVEGGFKTDATPSAPKISSTNGNFKPEFGLTEAEKYNLDSTFGLIGAAMERAVGENRGHNDLNPIELKAAKDNVRALLMDHLMMKELGDSNTEDA